MATNRPFKVPADAVDVDLSAAFDPPGEPPEPGMIWLGEEVGWRRLVVDDPEDREPLGR